MELIVRPFIKEDIPLLMNYWYTADEAYFRGMGADIKKLPQREDMESMLLRQLKLEVEQKQSFALIWEIDGAPIGHSNVNNIVFGKEAFMHLHLWQNTTRKSGAGTVLLQRSIPFYFETLNLETLYCEPYALNPAPNKTLPKAGFEFVKRYWTIPGTLNFEQEVNQYKITRSQYKKLYK